MYVCSVCMCVCVCVAQCICIACLIFVHVYYPTPLSYITFFVKCSGLSKNLHFRNDPCHYYFSLRKVLFMEAPEHYYNKDSWPTENDRK